MHFSYSPVGISHCNLSSLSFGKFVQINQSIILLSLSQQILEIGRNNLTYLVFLMKISLDLMLLQKVRYIKERKYILLIIYLKFGREFRIIQLRC